MTKGLRYVLGVATGTLAAGASVAVVEAAAHALLSGGPMFAAAAAAIGLGAFVGTLVANRISGRRGAGVAVIALLAILSLMNILSFAHPAWFVPAGLAMLAAGGWAGASLATSKMEQAG